MLPQLSTSLNKHPCVWRRKLTWRTRGINSVSRHAEQQIGDGGLLDSPVSRFILPIVNLECFTIARFFDWNAFT